MLKDQSFLEEYRTDTNNFVKEFYKKAFNESIEYWRAVGYFRSSSLEAFGSTLQNFLPENGKIKLITSVELTEDDAEAIENGLKSKKEISEERINTIIATEFDENIGNGVSKLAKLLGIDRLEIKNNSYGIWAIATGSRKTIISLATATYLLNSLPTGYVPLLVPYMHLVEQWASKCTIIISNDIKNKYFIINKQVEYYE